MKIKVDISGEWNRYLKIVPDDAKIIGTVTDDLGVGALVKIRWRYYSVNNGVVRQLDGRSVAAALGTGGRPKSMENGRAIRVYLDDETICRAKKMAGGNLSEGLRCAVWLATP